MSKLNITVNGESTRITGICSPEDIDKAIDKSIYKGNNTSNNNNTSGEEDN